MAWPAEGQVIDASNERLLRIKLYAIDQGILGDPLLAWFRRKANDLIKWDHHDRNLAAAIVELDERMRVPSRPRKRGAKRG